MMNTKKMGALAIGLIAVIALIVSIMAMRKVNNEKYGGSGRPGGSGQPGGSGRPGGSGHPGGSGRPGGSGHHVRPIGNMSGPHRCMMSCDRMCDSNDGECMSACHNVCLGLGNAGLPGQ